LLSAYNKYRNSIVKQQLQYSSMVFIKIPEDENKIRSFYLDSKYSIMQNIIKPKSVFNSNMVNIDTG